MIIRSRGEDSSTGIISGIMWSANINPCFNLVSLIGQSASDVSVIITHTDDSSLAGHPAFASNVKIVEIIHNLGQHKVYRVIYYILTQLRILYATLSYLRDKKTWIFFIDNGLILPMISAKLLRKKTLIILGGNKDLEIKIRKDYFDYIAHCFAKLNLHLCDRIVVYSPGLISSWNLEKHRDKIIATHRHFLDFGKFKVVTDFNDRSLLIGYIGRLSREKGILNLVQALPFLLRDHGDIHMMICGSGDMEEEIKEYLQKNNLLNSVSICGWIRHDDLPNHLNKLKLLVMPSYTEGLPNVMLEAMACGTPVLATPVGAIPDVIIDGKTGFIMENNSPECIAENVIRALNSPDLERIAEDGRRFVEENFTFETVVENWRRILHDIA